MSIIERACKKAPPIRSRNFWYIRSGTRRSELTLYILRLLVTHKMPSVKFVIVTLSLIAVMLMMTVQSRHLVPFKKNLDQVLKEWNCKGPQSQLVYLGNFKLFQIN